MLTTATRSEFKATNSTGFQLRVWRDQREGLPHPLQEPCGDLGFGAYTAGREQIGVMQPDLTVPKVLNLDVAPVEQEVNTEI